MPVTIQINGSSSLNSLAHKGSNGIATNTVPDVCKTPSPAGPVPIPYPIIVSMSSDLAKGSTTVKADGGNMIAIKDCEFSKCTGDEAGTAGGVVSSTFGKEAKFILYSFDVKIDGGNACRLSDKMTMNHQNTMCLAGLVQMPVTDEKPDLDKLAEECNKKVNCEDGPCPKRSPKGHECTTLGTKKHKCCEDSINDYNKKNPDSKLRSEVAFGKDGAPLSADTAAKARDAAATAYQNHIGRLMTNNPSLSLAQARGYARRAKTYMKTLRKSGAAFIADVLIGDPPTEAFDFKFNCGDKPKMTKKQKDNYKTYTGLVVEPIHQDGRKCPPEC